jgi:K+-sensing histidine kinase KdpD
MRGAHENSVDSIVIGQPRHGRVHEPLRGSVFHKLLGRARDADVHVVPARAAHRPA